MENKRVFNLILLGDPASGKATQAARLVKKYGLYDLDMGRELRLPSVRKAYDYKRTTAIGKLTPTGVYRRIFRRLTLNVPKHRGILFDGHPKMIGEAKFLEKLLRRIGRENPLFLYINVPLQETLHRVARGRRYGLKKIVRDDDRQIGLRNRARYYRTQIARVVKFFKSRYRFKRISGIGTRDEVFRRIVRFVEANIGKEGAR